MEVQKQRLKPGDIFWEKYNGKYFFGRIILDLNKIKHKLADSDPTGLGNNNLYGNGLFSSAYYVEILKGIYDKPELDTEKVLFIGIFCGRDFHSKKNYEGEGWEFYSHKPIDVKKIDFPENLKMFSPYMYFCKGEIKIKTNLHSDDIDEKELSRGMGMRFSFLHMINTAIGIQNRLDLIKSGDSIPTIGYSFIKERDFRFDKEFRIYIYKLIGEDPNISYYDLAKKYGIDTDRLFN